MGKSDMVKKLVILFVLIIISGNLFGLGGSASKNIKAARAKISAESIKCSPAGGEGTVNPLQAAGSLKKGMILHIMPGEYEKEIVVNADMVVVEGEPGKFCGADIIVKSKGCIVRNLWCRSISSNLDITIVDSVMTYFYTDDDSKGDIVFDNCCLGHIQVFSYNKDISLNNCSISNQGPALWLWGSKLSIENSIIYGVETAFVCAFRNKIKLDISNSVVFSQGNIAVNKDMSIVAKTFADLKKSKLPLTATLKKVIEEKPVFEQEPSSNVVYSYSEVRAWTRAVRSHVKLNDFVLKDDSPGKKDGLGAQLSADAFPQYVNGSKTPAPPAKKASQ